MLNGPSYCNGLKRILDFAAALLLLLLLSPLFIVTALALALAQRGRFLLLQQRPGKDGKIFSVIKFKTMTDLRDESGELLPDEQRLTALGRVVRRLSLDELPQLINVVRGEMSLVGPRPLLVEYLPLYSARQTRRHEVLPGITGLAQVRGRNLLAWEEKFEFDVQYVEHISLRLDLQILLETVQAVVLGRGVSSRNAATMERFTGSPPSR